MKTFHALLCRSKYLISLLLAVLSCFFLCTPAALAHHPHDVIGTVKLSPNYAQDTTVFVNYDGRVLLKSEDAGLSWHRVEGFVNHLYKLSALGIGSQEESTLYLASRGDGIYKSQNGGASWLNVNTGLSNRNIDLLWVCPDSPDIVFAAGSESGLYKTADGAATWQQVMPDDRKITALAFVPTQPEWLMIGNQEGQLYASQDGGQQWKLLVETKGKGQIQAIAVSPNFAQDNTVFVGTAQGGVLKSVNGGSSFSEVNAGLSEQQILSLGLSPNYATDSTIYATTWNQGVFVSTNGGERWQKHSRGLTKDAQADQSKEPHFTDLAISPNFSTDKTIFLAGFDGLFKSENEGRSWVNLETGNALAGDIKDIALSPDYANDSTIAINTLYQGTYLSYNQGNEWHDINTDLLLDSAHLKHERIGRVQDIAFSPNYRSDKTLLSGSDRYFLKSVNGGKSWHETQLTKSGWFDKQRGLKSSDWRITASPNFASDNTIYLRMLKGGGAILKSTDGGKNFSITGNLDYKDHTSSLSISPTFSSDQTLFLAASDGVYKSVDAGATWKLLDNGISLIEGDYARLAISPEYTIDGTVFAGTKSGLFKTTNWGDKWEKLEKKDYGDGYVKAIAISPNYQNDQTLMIGVDGRGLFKSIDGGKSFAKVDVSSVNRSKSKQEKLELLSTVDIKFSDFYATDQTVYVASETNLLRTTDGGRTWNTIKLPEARNSLHYLYLRFRVAPMLKFLFAFVIAVLGYLLLGYLKPGEKFRLSRLYGDKAILCHAINGFQPLME
jgi:photosystem II stability/assembly factor-like uncharacterized protein